ncbi:hypothetical protein FE784_32505 [Paenibacillus hemerocallicola]|uniref:Uncharacterized protein n=1 Tax=Paenibacillus hemerocallicola TaxID=1172614 RepID=A0A5C4SZH5_9BACL|nr:hypothetical protein [Paenibacillus hemerocallicola]TNJ62046.1 hypothetical protein FE784_32505 [Paenibacillus hemerocallicola]
MLTWEDIQKQYDVLFVANLNEMVSNGRSAGSIIDTYQEGLLSLYDRWNEAKYLHIDEFMYEFISFSVRVYRYA